MEARLNAEVRLRRLERELKRAEETMDLFDTEGDSWSMPIANADLLYERYRILLTLAWVKGDREEAKRLKAEYRDFTGS